MTKDLVIGIDSSTSATKAIAWDRSGRAVAEGRKTIGLANPQPGYFEQDPDEWWDSTAAALRRITDQVGASRIAAVAISNQRETFSAFTEEGTAIRPGMTWLDERARPQVVRFGKSFGAERVHAISGKPLDVLPCLYRIIWMAEQEPEIFARAARFAEVHGFLTYRLTGQWRTSTASADPTGLLDMESNVWSADILDAIGIATERLPLLTRPGVQTGEVTYTAAAITGLSVGTPVVAGGGDGQCAGTGAGVTSPGSAYINLGTAVVSGSYGRRYAYDRAFRTEKAVCDDGYIYEQCIRTGTFLVDWMAREMFAADPAAQQSIFKALEAEAASCPIGAGGVVVLPYWLGCMTPYWDPYARGVIAGLSGSTRRGAIYRALLEGIALEVAAQIERIVSVTGSEIRQLSAIGGGSDSDLWLQILADTSGRSVLRSTAREASSLGAAIAAAKGAGWYGTIAEASAAMTRPPAKTFQPDPKSVVRYSELRAIHADLWPRLLDWNARLASFAEGAQS
ncbi:FGGY-family carbohydrate kinase [Bradyrhizobium sp. CCGUVB1N3]|uniref:FGGY-family carbohydrate kinase n=1 Tax=Bradyrhizobium sp. CCGUVB1N3 TaxID=2949629 RepID=UPI0020B373ED|nr:FGGY-family carbohydrate kinase [Bradyrhizobium sp. CCGUVB1N3]MCP3469084.1 FGGY-family carbohydrate kinase [Bradyrhizobium sp. CCGUVB1N3]